MINPEFLWRANGLKLTRAPAGYQRKTIVDSLPLPFSKHPKALAIWCLGTPSGGFGNEAWWAKLSVAVAGSSQYFEEDQLGGEHLGVSFQNVCTPDRLVPARGSSVPIGL